MTSRTAPNPFFEDHPYADDLAALAEVLGTCTCYPHGYTPDTYEGPQEDCQSHGRPEYQALAILRLSGWVPPSRLDAAWRRGIEAGLARGDSDG